MNPLLTRLYGASPVFLQNVATTAFGYRLHRQRYGRESQIYLERLLASQGDSADAVRQAQDRRLAELVSHACRTTEYYGSLFRSHGVDPASIRSLDDLPRIPILERDTVRRNGAALRSSAPGKHPIVLHTSGTTGSPSAVYCDRSTRIYHYSFMSRLRHWFGVTVGMRRATLGGRIIVPNAQTRPPFWRYDWSENNTLFSSYHLSEANLRSYCDEISRIQPAEVTGYASSVYAVARYFIKENLPPVRPRVVMTTAETLLDHQREAIMKAFQVPLVDHYSCTEMVIFIAQCEHGTYHIHPEYGVVEVVDTDGRPLPPGQEGDVVCTGFVNTRMPLIRYRIGDRLTLGSGTCACGRHFPIVQRISGRMDDVIVTPDGRMVGRLDPIFKDLTGIAEAQFVQTDVEHLTLNVVRDPSFTDNDLQVLLKETRMRVGDVIQIEVNFVERIPRTKNGKFPAVVSRIKRP